MVPTYRKVEGLNEKLHIEVSNLAFPMQHLQPKPFHRTQRNDKGFKKEAWLLQTVSQGTTPGDSKTQMLTACKAFTVPFKVPERLLPSLCSVPSLLLNSYGFLQLCSILDTLPGGLYMKTLHAANPQSAYEQRKRFLFRLKPLKTQARG